MCVAVMGSGFGWGVREPHSSLCLLTSAQVLNSKSPGASSTYKEGIITKHASQCFGKN